MKCAENPPEWTVDLFNDFCAPISRYAEKHGLPMPVTKKGLIPLCDLGEEYGKGYYGVVWPTEQKGIVFKITSDETEAHFVKSTIDLRKEKGIDPLGITKYYGIVALPRRRSFGRKKVRDIRSLFLLWREEVDSTGIHDYGPNGRNFENNLSDFLEYAESVRMQFESIRKKSRNIDAYFDKVEDAVSNPSSWILDSISTSKDIAYEMMKNPLSIYIGEALSVYIEQGLLIADAHKGNVGKVTDAYGKARYKITDPGHVICLKRELANPEIEVIGK